MHNIIPYLALVIIFILKLVSKLSVNLSLREKLSTLSILGILGLCAYLWYFHMDNIPYISAAHILTYILVLPEVIARLVNIRRIKPTSIQISANSSNVVLGFLGTGIFAILSAVVIYFLFKEIESPNSEIVFDIKYFLIRLNTLFVFISGTIWMYLLATQKTTFYSDGLFYNGEIWKWSDFYSWSERMFENDVIELALASPKHWWRPARIKLKIPSGCKEQIDVLLEKNLEKL
jgi:hypothetical protein